MGKELGLPLEFFSQFGPVKTRARIALAPRCNVFMARDMLDGVACANVLAESR